MTMNHLRAGSGGQAVDIPCLARGLFGDAKQAGTGFGLGFAVTIDPARTGVPGNAGEFFWSGVYSTKFLVDPVEGVSLVFMAQVFPSIVFPIRDQLKTLVYAALIDSRA